MDSNISPSSDTGTSGLTPSILDYKFYSHGTTYNLLSANELPVLVNVAFAFQIVIPFWN